MIIDIHAHPVLLDVINEDPEDLSFRKQQFGVFKSGRNPRQTHEWLATANSIFFYFLSF